ncbi:MAG: hypothetical protein ABI383_12280 [Acidobacteriaceae bacterium]
MLAPRRLLWIATVTLSLGIVTVLFSSSADAGSDGGQTILTVDPSGLLTSYASVPVDLTNPFFQSIGTNGRSCASCHQAADGFGFTPPHVRERFNLSAGNDPIFRPNDGAVCPTADVSTLAARRQAYRMLLTKGLIRVSLAIPANADFQLVSVDDPYSCTSPSDIALFRRPLPATNLAFLSSIMWDGRESTVAGRSIAGDLGSQAIDATTGHAQGAVPTQQQVAQIVAFEESLTTAQGIDVNAGILLADGGNGSAFPLVNQPFYLGINDVLGGDPNGKPFNPVAMTVYSAWENLQNGDPYYRAARRAVGRGEALFNSLPIPISGVAGLNDVIGVPLLQGTCTTCHDSPNAGSHSLKLPIDIGIAAASRRTPDMPLYTFQCQNGQQVQTTDPGKAMISGKCADMGKMKGPVLRGLAARAPYFHNGSAADLGAVVDFYNTRFNLNITAQQKSDLVAFLKTL